MPPTRLALLIPLLIAIPATAQPPQDPIPTLHVTTRIVALDVVVTDGHGHPSTGLKPSDLSRVLCCQPLKSPILLIQKQIDMA
jgi:hypothetical protein